MTNEAAKPPKPRRKIGKAPARRTDPAPRRPLERAGSWTREHWTATRERLAQVRLKRPSKKALYWGGGIAATLVVAIAILFAIWDWNWFRGPVERIASARMHRSVDITGDLKVHPWSWQPSATVDGVRIANPGWAAKRGELAVIDRIEVKIRLLPLLKGDVDLRLLRIDRPNLDLYRDKQGRATWDFNDGKKKEPTRLPPIRNFIINDGKVRLNDAQREMSFVGAINAAERLGGENRGFEMRGKGVLNRQPFTAQIVGGPLLNIDKDKPYPFDADIRAGDTYVTARGAVPEPFDLGSFYMDTTVRGPDLADLYGLTGVALPNTPPYNLRGRMSREETLWRITGLGGRVGDSDLTGQISVETKGERPLLKADLRTRSLDFDDLGALFGGAPKVGPGETASPEQKVLAAKLDAQQRIFPDTTLNVEKIRSIDADVSYRAVSIRDAPINMSAASVRVKLDNGMLRAEPLRLDLPRGQVTGFVQLNARKATPVTDLDLRLANARLEQLLPIKLDGGQPFTGVVVGRAKLSGTGNSVHKALGNANGEVTVVIPSGEVREAFAELMGVNVTKGLGLLMSKNQDRTPIRCGVAHFNARGGLMTADQIVVDTGPVVITGGGTVNLDSERMAFRVQGHSKEFRLVRLLMPITAQGPIVKPKLGVEAGQAVAQGGVALALGALLSPLAAILPFVDPGLAKDANCAGLLAGAKSEGAPVKTAGAR